MIVYLDDPIISAQNLLKMISNLAKSQDTKSMCKNHKRSYTPILLFGSSNEEPNHEQTPTHNCYKRIKYIGIQVTKDRKNLFKENYKPLLKEIREDTDGKTLHAHD